MKKITLLVIVLLILSSFTACQRGETPTTASSTIEESSNISEHPPLFSADTVKETYLNLLETDKFYITSQQEQETFEYLSNLYQAYHPRLFTEESGDYTLVYLKKTDGYLYKNDERLNVHCTDLIDINSLVDIDGMSSDEVDEVYNKAVSGLIPNSNSNTIAKSLAFDLLFEKFGVSRIDYPRFFRCDSEIVIIYKVENIRSLDKVCKPVSILR